MLSYTGECKERLRGEVRPLLVSASVKVSCRIWSYTGCKSASTWTAWGGVISSKEEGCCH